MPGRMKHITGQASQRILSSGSLIWAARIAWRTRSGVAGARRMRAPVA